MSLDGSRQEKIRRPRSIAMKFITLGVLCVGIVVIIDALPGGNEFSPARVLFALGMAAFFAYLNRTTENRVKFGNKGKFVDTVKKALPRNYVLAMQTQTVLYFKPSSWLGRLFTDVVLVEIQGDTASITGELPTVRRLRQVLAKTGVASLV